MRWLYLFTAISLFSEVSYSQDLQITPSQLNFDGEKLVVSYDILNVRQSDKFYVWVMIENKEGQALKANSVSGDLGDVHGGKNKTITWLPANDSVFLNEEISVEVKAEKYIKETNKGSSLLLSAIVPGLGQAKMNSGKPYWLIGVASYGTLAGGLVTYLNYRNNYNKYVGEEDLTKRNEYLNKAEKNANTTNVLLASAAVIWTANLFWVALTPVKYKPLKYKPLSIQPTADPLNKSAFLTLRYIF